LPCTILREFVCQNCDFANTPDKIQRISHISQKFSSIKPLRASFWTRSPIPFSPVPKLVGNRARLILARSGLSTRENPALSGRKAAPPIIARETIR
jgi:hypothetical protein